MRLESSTSFIVKIPVTAVAIMREERERDARRKAHIRIEEEGGEKEEEG